MRQAQRRPTPRSTDALRLVALSRIPRCRECPRLAAMQHAVANGGRLVAAAPEPPDRCRDPICAPIVRQLEPAQHAGARGELEVSAVG